VKILRRPTVPSIIGAAVVCLIFVLAFFPSLLTSHSPSQIDPKHLLSSPSASHWLGTDELGADLLTRMIYGVKIEVIVSVGGAGIALVAGLLTGSLAVFGKRYFRGALDGVATGVLAFPLILLGVLVVASFGASATALVVVLGVAFWPQVHLLVRAQLQAAERREYVTAARLLEVPNYKILLLHLLPNSLRPLFVLVPQIMAVAILTEAGLSYLGLGVQPPAVSWGTLLLTSKDYYQRAPWYAVSTGLIITLTALALMYLGDRAGQGSHRNRRFRRIAGGSATASSGLLEAGGAPGLAAEESA
jgi:peptide/nickel transport system permease protein